MPTLIYNLKQKNMKKASMLTLATLFTFFTYAQSWNLVGNTNATATSFIGTTNAQNLVFKINNVERLRISNIGRFLSTGLTTSLFFGSNSGNESSTGVDNVGIGNNSLLSNTTGYNNTVVGAFALKLNTVGRDNTAIGVKSALSTTGISNVAVGSHSMMYNSTGNYNTIIGTLAMHYNSTGAENTSLGYFSMQTNTLGSNNTIIGNRADVGANNLNNATAIGDKAYVAQSNSLVLGSINGVNGATTNTNVGIGTTAPSAQLHTTGTVKFGGLPLNATPLRVIVSDIDGNIAYKDASTFGSTVDGSETKVNAGANVTVLGTGTQASPYIISATVPTIPAAQWVASSIGAGNIVNTNAGAVVIGSTVTTLPTGYKLYVADGILAEKVKVALKSGANWADYVFDKTYKLASLSEVESFIQKNKHLPGVPSAQELVKDGGIDMNQMFAKQMEKIEELTLYIIEQNKKIEKLEKVVKKLSK
jgi:trimeric autotransporter adhesin